MRFLLLLAVCFLPLAAGDANGPGLKANIPIKGRKSLVWEAVVPKEYKADKPWPAVLLLRSATAITDWQAWADAQGVLVISMSMTQTEPPASKPPSGRELDELLATITAEAGKRWNIHPALRVAIGLGGGEAGPALWRAPTGKWAQALVSLAGPALPASETLPPAWMPVLVLVGDFSKAPAQEVPYEEGAARLRNNGNPLRVVRSSCENGRIDIAVADAGQAAIWALSTLRVGHPQMAAEKKASDEELAKRTAAIAALSGNAEKVAACEELLACAGLDRRPAAADLVKLWQDSAWAAASASAPAIRYHALADLLAQPRAAAAPWAKEAKSELAALQKDDSLKKEVQARRAYEALAAEEATTKDGNLGKLKKLSKSYEELSSACAGTRYGQLALKAVARLEPRITAIEKPRK